MGSNARPVAAAAAAGALLLAGCHLGAPRETIIEPAHALAAGDLDGDSLTDFVTVGVSHETPTNEGRVSVLLARPGGGFDVTEQVRTDVYDDRDTDVALVDADTDGDEDVVLIDDHRGVWNNVYLLENEGGVLGPRQIVVERLSLGSRLTVGDVNDDGNSDLVLSSADLLVLLGDGAGGFTLDFDAAPRQYASRVEISDVDGDGLDDLLVGTMSAANTALVEVYRQLPTGWAPPVPHATDPAMRLPVALAVADMNGDSVLDLVAASQAGDAFYDPGSVSVLVGVGDGSFAPPVVAAGIPRLDGRSAELGTGDIDGDGFTDVVLATAAACGCCSEMVTVGWSIRT